MSRNGFLILAGLLLCSLPHPAPGQSTPAPAPASSPALDTDPHLLGWWRFDEVRGSTVADSSGKGHPGTLEGSLASQPQLVPGRDGKALQLGGDKDCVRIAGFKGVTGTQARTVALWIKHTAPGGDLVTWGQNEPGKLMYVGFVRGRFGINPRGGYLYMKASTHDDAWHHVAAVIQEASLPNLHDHVKLYRDGEPAEIDDIGLLDLYPFETGDQQDVCLGRRFKGLLDDFRIYDRPLSEDEVKALFKLQTNRPLPKP